MLTEVSEGAASRVWHRGPRGGEVRGRGHWSSHHVEDPRTEDRGREVAQSVLQSSPHFCEEGDVAAGRGRGADAARRAHRGLRGSVTITVVMQEVGRQSRAPRHPGKPLPRGDPRRWRMEEGRPSGARWARCCCGDPEDGRPQGTRVQGVWGVERGPGWRVVWGSWVYEVNGSLGVCLPGCIRGRTSKQLQTGE